MKTLSNEHYSKLLDFALELGEQLNETLSDPTWAPKGIKFDNAVDKIDDLPSEAPEGTVKYVSAIDSLYIYVRDKWMTFSESAATPVFEIIQQSNVNLPETMINLPEKINCYGGSGGRTTIIKTYSSGNSSVWQIQVQEDPEQKQHEPTDIGGKLEGWTTAGESHLHRSGDEVGQPVHHRLARQSSGSDREIPLLASK